MALRELLVDSCKGSTSILKLVLTLAGLAIVVSMLMARRRVVIGVQDEFCMGIVSRVNMLMLSTGEPRTRSGFNDRL